MYGFNGHFDVVRVQRIRPQRLYEPFNLSLLQKISALSDFINFRRSHLIWEFSKANT
jgi:hypothetical protein